MPGFFIAAIDVASLIKHTTIKKRALKYLGKKITALVAAVNWNINPNTLQLNNFSVLPNEGKDETFRKTDAQVDYLEITGKSVDIQNIQYRRHGIDSGAFAGKIILDEITLNTTKVKRLPFIKGLDKLMPTEMIRKIKMPLIIDTILLQN